jgi:hypothetical protein
MSAGRREGGGGGERGGGLLLLLFLFLLLSLELRFPSLGKLALDLLAHLLTVE